MFVFSPLSCRCLAFLYFLHSISIRRYIVNPRMAQISCRLSDPLNEMYEKAARERGVFKSEIVREALRYYVRENPRGLRAFPDHTRQEQRNRTNGGRSGSKTVTEAQVKPEEMGQSRSGEEAEENSVYDPCEELENGSRREDAG